MRKFLHRRRLKRISEYTFKINYITRVLLPQAEACRDFENVQHLEKTRQEYAFARGQLQAKVGQRPSVHT